MSIAYLCPSCARALNKSGFDAVNEIGRKHCIGCGNNDDWLIVVDRDGIEEEIEAYNKGANNERS